jgi:hypothetical protein
MSEMPTFLRHCPSCGKRFHVTLVGKKLVGQENLAEETPDSHGRRGLAATARMIAPSARNAGLVGPQTDAIVVDSENHEHAFKCGHCGHEWTENRVEGGKVVGGETKGYTGD